MNRVRIKRPVTTFERQGPWVAIAGGGGLVLLGLTLLFGLGALDSINPLWFGRNFRGYTAIGLTMGIVAVALSFVCFAYSARKRRAKPEAGTTMMTWLWVHVYIGTLALVAAILHAGFGLVSWNMSSGKILFFAFALIMISGVAWRLAYGLVPGIAAPQILNYSADGAQKRADDQKTEIEKTAAGKSAAFRQVTDLLLSRPLAPNEIAYYAQSLPPEEHAALTAITQLAESRNRALGRLPLQKKYTRLLQGWRVLHVPVALFFLLALVAHVVGASGLVKLAVPKTAAVTGPLATYGTSEDCGTCHAAIYKSWSSSMHANALSSPVTIVQNNIDIRTSLAGQPAPDPQRICINCHGPSGTAQTPLANGAGLPLAGGIATNHGITCVACHQHRVVMEPGTGGVASIYQENLEKGSTYFGTFSSPVGNSYHKSSMAPAFVDPNAACAACHDVHLDRNGDGKIEKGVDLVLQTTFDEYKEYQAAGGKETCVSCHMPALAGVTRAADGASIPFDQDFAGPDRVVLDHSFAGVDYPLDTVAQSDPQKAQRAALLATSANLSIDTARVNGANLDVSVSVENKIGHDLPTGFAFARQMWIELVVKGPNGEELFASGKLPTPTSDLCDDGTFGDLTDPLRQDVNGCTQVDKQLVSFQTKLVDKIAIAAGPKNDRGEFVVIKANNGVETFLQFITGGPVGRVRPLDKVPLGQLLVGQKRSFNYIVPLRVKEGGSVSARLLFRNLPPYFIRAMGRDQAPNEQPRIEPMIGNLQTVEMAKRTVAFTR